MVSDAQQTLTNKSVSFPDGWLLISFVKFLKQDWKWYFYRMEERNRSARSLFIQIKMLSFSLTWYAVDQWQNQNFLQKNLDILDLRHWNK